MKTVIISECKIRELPVIEQVLLHYPNTQIIQPVFDESNPSSLNPFATLGKKALGKLHRKLLKLKLYPRRDPPYTIEKIPIPIEKINQAEGIQLLKQLSPDILITCRAPLLKPELIQIPKLSALNIHYGIAPNYRGNDSLFWALYNRDYEHLGGCIHYLTQGVDRGNILAEVFPALQKNDGEVLVDIKTTRLLSEALIRVLKKLEIEQAQPPGKPQTHKGKNYRSKDRTFGKSLAFILKNSFGFIRPPNRSEKIHFYF